MNWCLSWKYWPISKRIFSELFLAANITPNGKFLSLRYVGREIAGFPDKLNTQVYGERLVIGNHCLINKSNLSFGSLILLILYSCSSTAGSTYGSTFLSLEGAVTLLVGTKNRSYFL